MTIAITTKEKKMRGFDSLINQFASEPKSASPEEPANLIEGLNRMIETGASFEVTAEDFQVVGAERLTVSETDYLAVNRISIHCILQQALLARHLFSSKPELLKKFIESVNERDARFDAVVEITKKWFTRLLKTISDGTNPEN